MFHQLKALLSEELGSRIFKSGIVYISVPSPASPLQGRSRDNKGHTNWYKDFAMKAYTALVTFMMAAGAFFVARAVAPDVSVLMANVSVSNEHFMRQNPKWNKAKVAPDKNIGQLLTKKNGISSLIQSILL